MVLYGGREHPIIISEQPPFEAIEIDETVTYLSRQKSIKCHKNVKVGAINLKC